MRIISLLAAALLSACAPGKREPFVPTAAPSDAAVVRFYRPSEMSGRLISPTLSIDGKEIGKLSNDSWGEISVAPGDHALRSYWPGIPGTRRDDSASLSVEAGKAYYLRVRYQVTKARDLTPSIPGIGAASFENRVGLEEVKSDEAVPQMTGMSRATLAFPPAKAN